MGLCVEWARAACCAPVDVTIFGTLGWDASETTTLRPLTGTTPSTVWQDICGEGERTKDE